MRRNKSATNILLALPLALLLQPSVALGQNEAVTAQSDSTDPEIATREANQSRGPIEEVIVSARKRSESTQEIAGALTAFTGNALNESGIADVKDLQNVTPGLTVTEMASYSLIFIRGIGTDSFQGPIDSSVATYIDGLYVTYTSSQAQALGNVSSVTVLKGPQGTLYGRNAVGGAIIVESVKPSEEFQASVSVEGGNYNHLKGKAYVSGPIMDRVAGSLSVLHHNRETYLKCVRENTDCDGKHKDYDDRGLRGSLRVTPTDWLDITANYYKINHTSADGAPLTNSEVAPAFQNVLTPNDTPFETGVGTEVFTEMETEFLSLSIEFDNPWFSTRALIGDTQFFSNIFWDYDLAEEKLLVIEATPNTADTTSLDVTFNSNPDAGPSWFSWIGGLYVEDTFKDQRTPVIVDTGALAAGIAAGNADPAVGDLINDGVDALEQFAGQAGTVNLVLYGGVQTDAQAAFAEFTFDVTDDLTIRVGGRYSDETREITEAYVNQRDPDTGAESRLITYEPMERSWTDFTPSAAFEYQLTDNKMVYLSYGTAFKSGNWNALNINEPPNVVEPEEAETFELGAKTEWLGGKLRVNGSVFSTSVENGHVQILSLASGGVTRLDNAGKFTVEGAELEIQTYLTPNLRLSLAGTYLDGVYDEYDDCVGFSPESGLEETRDSCAGNETVRTPPLTATLDINYEFPFFWGMEGQIGGGVYYNSGFEFNAFNDVQEEQFEKYNARFSIFDPESNVKVYGFGSNLNNAVSHLQKFRQDFGIGESYARPRMYGFGVEWNY